MSRSKWKGPLINKQNLNFNNKIFSRDLVLTKFFLNKVIFVYNGKILIKILITENMIGYKAGEFISTRKKFNYK
jgi:ribosomal protein S19